MDVQKLVYENAIQIAKNSTNIGMFIKVMYFVGAAIITQIVISISHIVNGKRNGKV